MMKRNKRIKRVNNQNFHWKHLDLSNKKAAAEMFLSNLIENVPSFVSSIVVELNNKYNMDVANLQADHVCYRTESIEQYNTIFETLLSADRNFTLLIESDIGGRQIATFKLATPIEVKLDDSAKIMIDDIEIPSPKEGSPYKARLEHVEFVIGDGSLKSPINDEAHKIALKDWVEKFPSVPWNLKVFDKQCNPGVSTKLKLEDHGKVSIKFHLMSLEDVIKFESEELFHTITN